MSVTLAELTDFMSEVGKERPDLVQDRNVSLFIELVIDKARLREKAPPETGVHVLTRHKLGEDLGPQ